MPPKNKIGTLNDSKPPVFTPYRVAEMMGHRSRIETDGLTNPRIHRQRARQKHLNALKLRNAAETLAVLPVVDECFHIVSAGNFDFFNYLPHAMNLIGGQNFVVYISTWTMNRANALAILDLIDAATIKHMSLMTGLYFKRRETAVYTTIAEGLIQRGQRFVALLNHTKIMLIGKKPGPWLVFEGSANFTANPRIEQFVVSNDQSLFNFHREWMDEIYDR